MEGALFPKPRCVEEVGSGEKRAGVTVLAGGSWLELGRLGGCSRLWARPCISSGSCLLCWGLGLCQDKGAPARWTVERNGSQTEEWAEVLLDRTLWGCQTALGQGAGHPLFGSRGDCGAGGSSFQVLGVGSARAVVLEGGAAVTVLSDLPGPGTCATQAPDTRAGLGNGAPL